MSILGTAAAAAGTALRGWRIVPGVAGAAAVSVAIGELTGHLFGHGLTPWVALLAGGAFALLFGTEVNRRPPAPRSEETPEL